jgi:hypothetical protein
LALYRAVITEVETKSAVAAKKNSHIARTQRIHVLVEKNTRAGKLLLPVSYALWLSASQA